MPTKIYSAIITISGTHIQDYGPVAIKKLPLFILMSDPNFIRRLIRFVGDKQWKSLKIEKNGYPKITITYKDYLGVIAAEPELPFT